MIRGHIGLNFGRQHAEAEADFRAALRVYQELGERWGMAFTLSSLAALASWRGDFATALAVHEQALALVLELGTDEDIVQFRLQIARARWLLGDRETARAELARARREADRVGLPELRAAAAYASSEVARNDGDLADARAHLLLAAQLAGDEGVAPQFRAMIATGLGYVAAGQGDLAEARTHHTEALAHGRAATDAPVIAQVLVGLADLALRSAQPRHAAWLLGASLGVRGVPDLTVVDEARIEAAARAALGDPGYEEEYRRGRSVTMSTLDEVDFIPSA
jgi:tetratricopeptide (TPR) repeat protein